MVEALHHVVQRGAGAQRHRGRGQRVHDVVAARQRQHDVGGAGRRVQPETRTVGRGHDRAGAHVGVVLQAEAQHPARADALQEPGREGVVGVHHRHAVVGQRLVDRALGLGDAQQAAHALHVRGHDVVHQGDVRRRDRGQVGDVARLARAHLVDGETCVFGRVQHRQRQADLVVAVARVGVGLAGARQDAEQQGFHRGLAVAAGQRHHHGRPALLHAGGEFAQRFFGVGAQHLRQRAVHFALHEQGHGAAFERLGGVVVAVVALAAQRDEEAAGHHAAAVDAHGRELDVGAEVAAFDPAGGLGKRDRPHRPASRACSRPRATCRSSNGCFTPATSW